MTHAALLGVLFFRSKGEKGLASSKERYVINA